jgi:hypothetical protein
MPRFFLCLGGLFRYPSQHRVGTAQADEKQMNHWRVPEQHRIVAELDALLPPPFRLRGASVGQATVRSKENYESEFR